MTCKKSQGTDRIKLFLSANVCEHCGGTGTNPKWTEQDDVIRFSVTSDGTTGEEWIAHLEKKGFRVLGCAKSVLRSEKFQPTSGVTTEIAVLKGMLFSDDDRVVRKIRAEAERRFLSKPNPEIACLIREKFSDSDLEAMGILWLAVMHEPIADFVGAPCLLDANRCCSGRCLQADHNRPEDRWNRDTGFAFVVPQASL